MTLRQTVLKFIYPLLIKAGNWFGMKAGKRINKGNTTPPVSFYSLGAVDNSGADISLALFAGKKVLIVNTASDCGYTKQYAELEQLYKQYKDSLVILAFPSNDFKEQEKGSDKEIEEFCRRNFGITFSVMKKCVVVKNEIQHPVFEWLSNPFKNGWNDKAPEWNFSKYLVDESGILTHYFGPGISPLDNLVVEALRS